ncbi:MAG: hypothetical protein DUD27_07820 [Lachnospiraceae bacterium]|uniref:Nitric oxide reductase activation protein n=1 Tax=Candidatus Weimeria bifida TaxID=2599074 RepID=A0A6N7J0H3_9FIRM|nr:hypothetical protein [Candidatus Weimeria bifida]RRF95450.1 MAG: hypothetical protein DUD27_07820 [Lachnospiraceae bacterium]
MEITDFEKKRASNLIWNGAHDYSIETGFRVYDEDGHADIYWNTMVGVIHRRYDWEKLLTYYNSFHEKINQGVYESLFWIAMENGAFQKEVDKRYALSNLRKEYAARALEETRNNVNFEDSAGERLIAVTHGHLHHCLGEDAQIPDIVDRKLLDAIEIPGDLDTDGAIERIDRALKTYFPYTSGAHKKTFLDNFHIHLSSPIALIRRKVKLSKQESGPVRHMSFGYGEHTNEYGGSVVDQSHLTVSFAKYTAQTDEGLKKYISNYFGNSVCSENETKRLQKEYCYGNHTDVKLHFTRGDYDEKMLDAGFAGKMHKQAIDQAKDNERAYKDNEVIHRVQIEKLTEKIRNSVLVRMEDQTIRSKSGKIVPAKVWRALYLDDDRIFKKTIPGDNGNISVDLLLDASTSEIHRQEIVAAQGYMIAEALTKCNIPVRVYSFCSMTGYTVINLYRDYSEKDRNREIFRYATTGANRDGMAIRIAAGLMSETKHSIFEENHADHKLLIVLSDCTPNDMIKVRTGDGRYRDYAAEVGVLDTAAEVHSARMKGINVLCVFTGNDKSLPNVHKIYGSDFARIRQLDMFADAVGTMLQTRIERT